MEKRETQERDSMKSAIQLERQWGYAVEAEHETGEVLAAMTEPVEAADVLETLVAELKRAGIWGRLGEISWARDTRDGLLLQWVPAH